MDVIRAGVNEIVPEDELVRKLEHSAKKNVPLNVKLGADPSRPDLHLGHAVVLRKLRHFQDLGHQAILIIGDFTGMIGDPTGRSKTRPSLTLEETRRNGQTYFEQATTILSGTRMKMMYNSEWLARMSFVDVVYLASKYTVARMLERDDFEKRYSAGEAIGVHEFLYPLAQAMDSVAVKADIELGGTDQKFNLLVAREIQREYGQDPQTLVIMPILEGTGGREKMSKSLDNYIAISDSPEEMYGKTMSIPDTHIERYFELGLFASKEELMRVHEFLARGGNPRDVKRELARRLVTLYSGSEKSILAEKAFDELFVNKHIPTDIPEWSPAQSAEDYALTALLTESKLTASGGEARRLIEQGGVSVDGEKITDAHKRISLLQPVVVKAGKRKFVRIIPPSVITH